MKRKMFAASLVMALTLLGMAYVNTSTAYAGTWKQNSVGWWYQNDNGTYKANEWLQDTNGTWYRFNSYGYMIQGGWAQVDGVWYYFDSAGKMAANQWIGSYYVDSSGAWQQNATQTTTAAAATTTTPATTYTLPATTYTPSYSYSTTPKISEATAKQTALARVPGASNIYMHLDWDDGRLEYEGSIYYGNWEYEFSIDANTGYITDWDIDSIWD